MTAVLVDLATVKQLVGIHAAITTFDLLIQAAADAGNGTVLEKLGYQTLAVHTFTEWPEVFSNSQRSVQLRHWPVVSVIGLTNGTTALDADDYRISDEGQVTLRGNPTILGMPMPRFDAAYWNPGADRVEITYTAGWTDQTVPAPLKLAAQLIAVDVYNRMPKAGMTEQRTRGWYTILSETDMPPMARAILNRYCDARAS